jgi:hypothetical protein
MAGSLADPALVGWRLGEEFPLLARWQVDSGAIGRGSRRRLPELTHSQVNCVIVQLLISAKIGWQSAVTIKCSFPLQP